MAEFEEMATNEQPAAESEITRQVIFCVGEELLGVDVLNIREIVPFVELNKVPNAPKFIKGVLDFRGKIIPVIIPQVVFNIEIEKESTIQQIILVIQTTDKLYGVLVDQVFDIVNFKKDDLQIIEELHKNEKTKYLKYFGKLDDKVIMFINPEKLIEYEYIENNQDISVPAVETVASKKADTKKAAAPKKTAVKKETKPKAKSTKTKATKTKE